MIDHLEIARVRVEVERAYAAVAAAVGARVVGMQAVTIVFFVLAGMPAALEDVGLLLVGADHNTGLVGLAGLAAEEYEVRLACLEPLERCTLRGAVAGRHSRWQLGGLG